MEDLCGIIHNGILTPMGDAKIIRAMRCLAQSRTRDKAGRRNRLAGGCRHVWNQLTLCLLATLYGCQSVSAPMAGAPAEEGPPPFAPAQLRAEFLAGDDLPKSMDRLIELESEAVKLLEYEPLKLGAIGSAILDVNPASLVGHHVLQRFYEHVDATDAASEHGAWAQATKAAMSAGATGSIDEPFSAVTPIEAQIFLHSEGLSPVGAIYQSTEAAPLLMMVQGRPERGPLRVLHFALQGIYLAAEHGFAEAAGEAVYSPLALMGILARQGDPAAQTAVGALLLNRERVEDAIGWLQAGSRFNNVIANNILARIHWTRANQADPGDERQAALNESLDNYLQAIALGSSEAMYALGALYLSGAFGGDNADSAIPLLKQAAKLDNSDALLYLAHLHYAGNKVAQDRQQAEDYFVRAAALNNEAARLSYARYLMRERGVGDSRTVGWLEETVKDTANPEAMLMLGNLHARGVATQQNLRIAHRWYRDAAKAGTDNAQIVNEVAWTLAVSDLKRLRRGRFANRIMTKMMESNEQARAQPEYLDTWAATYAATGNFREAVRLQELALQEAIHADRDDVLDILQQHLDLFLAGKPVIEPAP